MNNAEYWEKRQLKRYTSGEKKLIEHYKKLERVMERSRKDIEAVINKFYIEYASENEISYAEAQRTLNKREIGELKEFIERVNEHMGEYDQELNNMSIKARITRYEALLKQIDAVLQRTYTEYEQASLKELTGIYEDTYYRACFDIDQYNGFHKEFAQLDQKGIQEIINYPFDGRSFSDRIWKQKEFLLDKITQSFTQMIVQGKHPKTLSKEFAKQFKSREYDAYRLLHTEYSYLAENASQKAYEEDEVPAYKYLATLDSRTCGVCGKLDGRIVKMGDGKFGVNMPPLHPLCRCTTVPYYEKLEDEGITRIARNKDGENIEVPYDMSYEEWKDLLKDENNSAKQFYKTIIKGKLVTISKLKNVTLNLQKVEGYDNIFISKKANIKPKALHNINLNTEEAMRKWGIPLERKPKIVIVSLDEISNAYGKYDAITNTVYYIPQINDKKIVPSLGEVEYHEMWHMKQAEKYRKSKGEITEENYVDYLKYSCKKAKKKIDDFKINEYNVSEISTYAKQMYSINRFDEVEADYMAKYRRK